MSEGLSSSKTTTQKEVNKRGIINDSWMIHTPCDDLRSLYCHGFFTPESGTAGPTGGNLFDNCPRTPFMVLSRRPSWCLRVSSPAPVRF